MGWGIVGRCENQENVQGRKGISGSALFCWFNVKRGCMVRLFKAALTLLKYVGLISSEFGKMVFKIEEEDYGS